MNNNNLLENLNKNEDKLPVNAEIEKLIKEKVVNENQFFLLLSIYFYLKHNNYNVTAEILFTECNLGNKPFLLYRKHLCFPSGNR